MKVICRTRHKGKTTDLLQIAIYKGYIFVTLNHREIERLKFICQDANQDPPEFWTYDQLINGAWHGRRDFTGIVVDNVDMLLQQLAGPLEVVAAAINQDEPDQENQ